MLDNLAAGFRIIHCRGAGLIETQWRDCLAASDFPTHYTAPEYFLEPALRDRKPFAILSAVGNKVTAVLTGIHDGERVQSGLSVRPQIAFSRQADRSLAMSALIAGLLQEARSAKLVDLYLWSDMAGPEDARFRQKHYAGVVVLDLSRGPEALFRKFSQTRRNDIRRAIRRGVSVEPANGRDDVSAYYPVYVEWARYKGLPIAGEDQFQETFALTHNRLLLLARYEGHIIAGAVLRFFPRGVVEYAANSSLENSLHLRPNDLLQWRAVEWACAEGMTKYSLGGDHLFLRKSGGEVFPTTRHRLDLSMLRRYTVGDWIADRVEDVSPVLPRRVAELGRSLRSHVQKLHTRGGGAWRDPRQRRLPLSSHDDPGR